MKVSVFTSDHHSWLLRGFFHQWEKYGGLRDGEDYATDPLSVEVVGFSEPAGLPPGVSFCSIGDFVSYPVEKWSDAIIKYLRKTPDELFMFVLEDYWLIRPMRRSAIFKAFGYMEDHPDVIRFDLTSDRMFAPGAMYIESYSDLDICSAKGAYSLSFQAAIYRKSLLLEILRYSWTPWQAEIFGSSELNKLPYRVVGTYQWPMNYAIVVNKGKLDMTGSWMVPARTLKQADWIQLSDLGYLSPEIIS